MNDLNIYWSSIEFIYKNTSQKKDKLKGGFVYCLVKAFDAKDAIAKIELSLKSQNKTVKKIDFVSVYDEDMEWETKEQTKNFIQIYNQAKKTLEVVFDDFYSYEED